MTERRRTSNSDEGTTIPPVPYGFAPQGGMSGAAGFAGVVRAFARGNKSQKRAARIVLGAFAGVAAITIVALAIAALLGA